ncbi:MAG: hypothetical protein QM820_34200 [Minicystis sp.]
MNRLLGFFSLAACVVAFSAGCAEASALARARAAREYNCPEDKVLVRWVSDGPKGSSIYKVSACGTVATYVCEEVHETCLKESEDRH